MDFWKVIQSDIFSNDQLDIYEKMCLLVLMSLDEDVNLSSIQLSNYMGCGLNTAKRAFDSLRIKGYLSKDYFEGRRSSNVIRNEEALEISKPVQGVSDDFRAGFFMVPEENSPDHESLVDVRKDHRSDDVLDQELDRKRQLAAYLLSNEPSRPSSTSTSSN